MPILLLNFSHPLTATQQSQVAVLAGGPIDLRDCPTQIDHHSPLAPQAVALADAVGLTPSEWQTTPLIVNVPGLAVLATTLLAEVHGRCGYFPAVLRLRPLAGAVATSYEVAELINLDLVRQQARTRR
jgi:hypothetical protein